MRGGRWSVACAVALVAALGWPAPASAADQALGEIHGVVRLDDGTPLGGVWVDIWGADKSSRVSTAPDGTFRTWVEAGRYTVSTAEQQRGSVAWHRTYAPGTTRSVDAVKHRVREGKSVDASVRVVRSAMVTGRVVDESGAPVAGAWVHVESASDNQLSASSRTDPEGRYQVPSLGSHRKLVIAVTKGSRLGTRTVSTAKDGSAKVAKITLLKRGRAKVTVRLRPNEPAPSLRLVDRDGQDVEESRVTSTGKRKTYTFTGLAPGTYRAVLSWTGRSVSVRVKPGQTTRVGPISPPRVERSYFEENLGTVRTPNGKPASAAKYRGRVEICRDAYTCAYAYVDSSGKYRFRDAAPGKYRAVATSGQGWGEFGHRFARVTTLRIEKGPHPSFRDITLQRTRKVTLVLTDRSGSPVKGIIAWLGERATSGTYKQSNSRGTIVWKGVPAARYRVSITDNHPYGYCDAGRTVKKSGDDVTVRVKLARCDGT